VHIIGAWRVVCVCRCVDVCVCLLRLCCALLMRCKCAGKDGRVVCVCRCVDVCVCLLRLCCALLMRCKCAGKDGQMNLSSRTPRAFGEVVVVTKIPGMDDDDDDQLMDMEEEDDDEVVRRWTCCVLCWLFAVVHRWTCGMCCVGCMLFHSVLLCRTRPALPSNWCRFSPPFDALLSHNAAVTLSLDADSCSHC
jgi:hypothetical protein